MMDLNVCLESVDHDEELLCDVIGAFLEEYPLRLVEIDQSLERQDLASLRRACHTLKGTLRIFGAVVAMQKARDVESVADERCTIDIPPILLELRAALEQLAQELRDYLEHRASR